MVTWHNSRDKKSSFEHFSSKSRSFYKCCNFLKYQVFILFIYNKARKLKVAEANQAEASSTKLWLATDEAHRSPIVWEQFTLS